MNKRVLKILVLVVSICAALAVGAAVGGGAVYALTRVGDVLPLAQAQWFDTERGVVIASVEPGGPADEAGVARGDILLEMDGQAVDDFGDLLRYLQEVEPGDQVELKVLHGDDERNLTATVGEQEGHPYLGLLPCGRAPVDVSIRIGKPGAAIVEVVPDSPAEEAGLREGDVIVALDGQELGVECALADLITGYQPGDTVTLEIEHPGEEPGEVPVALGEHPDEEDVAYLGIRYRCLPRVPVVSGEIWPFGGPHRFEFDRWPFVFPHVEFERGAIVLSVAEDSPPSEAGLEKGDVITGIDGEPVEGTEGLTDAVAEREPGDTVTLTVYRADWGEEREIEVTLGEHPREEEKAYLGVRTVGFVRPRHLEGEEGRRFHFFVPPFHLQLPQIEPFFGVHDLLPHFESEGA
jgi:S1-C subfamily serine protease